MILYCYPAFFLHSFPSIHVKTDQLFIPLVSFEPPSLHADVSLPNTLHLICQHTCELSLLTHGSVFLVLLDNLDLLG